MFKKGLILICIALNSGCGFEGAFEGKLKASHSIAEESVHIDVEKLGTYFDPFTEIQIRNESHQLIQGARLKGITSKGCEAFLPGFGLFHLKRVKHKSGESCSSTDPTDRCYKSPENTDRNSLCACFGHNAFAIRLSDPQRGEVYRLWGHHSTRRPFRDKEPEGQVLTFDEVISRTLVHNVTSKIEYSRTIQAVEQLKSSLARMIPHLSMDSILFNVPPSIATGVYAAGDIVPFLLPNRWFDIFRDKHLSKAARDSYNLVRGNLIASAEAIAYRYFKDRETLSAADEMLAQIERLLGKLEVIDPHHPLNSELRTLKQVLLMDLPNQRFFVDASRNALSESLGFNNPHALEDITVGIEDPALVDAQEIPEKVERSNEDWAVLFAFDRQQAIHQQRAEHYQTWSHGFSPLDPQGDPVFDMGPQMYYKIKQSLELEGERLYQFESKEPAARHACDLATREYNTQVQIYQMLKGRLIESDEQIKEILETPIDQFLSLPIAQKGLVEFLRGRLEEQLRVINVDWNFRVARSKIDRLLLHGPYIKLIYIEDYQDPKPQSSSSGKR